MIQFPKADAFLVPEGTHPAVCYLVAELGTQETDYGNKPMIHIGWEIPDERLNDGRVAVVSRRYSMSAHPKSSLRGDIESWQGRRFSAVDLDAFDIGELVGQTCLVVVQHSDEVGGRIYANVAGVMAPPRGSARRADTENDPVIFAFDSPDASVMYGRLPEFLRTAISRSPEFEERPIMPRIEQRRSTPPAGPPRAQAALRERLAARPQLRPLRQQEEDEDDEGAELTEAEAAPAVKAQAKASVEKPRPRGRPRRSRVEEPTPDVPDDEISELSGDDDDLPFNR